MKRALVLGVPIAVIAAFVAGLLLGGAFSSDDAPSAVVVVTTTASATATATATSTPTSTPTPTPTPAISEPDRYREAIAARDAGDLETAASGLRGIVDTGGPLAPFASFRLAQVLASDGDPEGAVEAFDAALADPVLPASLRPIGQREGAAALIAAGRPTEAIDWLSALIVDPAASSSEQFSARWERAELLLDSDDPAWADDALAIVTQSPGHPTAWRALDALELAEVETPALSAAYARYLARQNGLATERYGAILAGEPSASHAGVAWFYLGALAERVPDRAAAIDAYGESLVVDPTGIRADDAAYWRGRVAEEDGDFAAAMEFYDTLAREYPGSGFNGDGALRGALATFEAGDEAGGLERLGAIALAGGTHAASASRWYELLAGVDARIDAGVPAASAFDPRSYSAILEGAGDDALEPPVFEPLPPLEDGSDAVDTWLVEHYGVSTGTSRIDEDEFVAIVQILADAGERSLARAFFLDRLDAVDSDPHAVIGLSTRATDLELPDAAMLAALRLIGPMSVAERLDTPLALERLAYPAPWRELVDAASEEFEVPPLLLLALIRQESAFEPDVVSAAGAIGLTQVIPPTGVQIANTLDEEWGGVLSLADPATALRYGASYLSTQLEAFDGNVFAALAAYNGGPSNAQRWLDSQVEPGADGFIQTIDFEETRRYVTTVIEQYGWYRYSYGLADQPAIR
jgi:soluble lytic murein transglycosylase